VAVVGAYVIGGVVVAPVTVFIVATAIAFGPLLGLTYSLLGCMLSAMLTFGIGSLMGRESIRRLAGEQVSRLSQRMARHGLMAILIVRLLPVAPFTVVNVIAGAAAVRFRDFILATFLGMLPGLLAMTFLGNRLESVIRQPTGDNFMILGAVVVALVAVMAWLHRRFASPDVYEIRQSAPHKRKRARLPC
jgi:uncharacterized membrane protein YdjX (TVP38/TMEM64 family)